MLKIIAKSNFHDNIEQTFCVPAQSGDYFRRCPRACDNKKVGGIAVHCGCGWPVSRTTWIAPRGWEVRAEWTDGWMHCGRANIVIHLQNVEA